LPSIVGCVRILYVDGDGVARQKLYGGDMHAAAEAKTECRVDFFFVF
jgi:hypothetical protein